MLASRILKAAEDFLEDYKEFKIIEMLQQAVQCASRNMQPTQFASTSKQLNEMGQILQARSRICLYPQELRVFLQESSYNIALPENIGRFLEEGFKGDLNTTPSSNEVNFRLSAASTTNQDLLTVSSTLKKLNIYPITVPKSHISIDFLLPRTAFSNNTKEFLESNEKFSNLLSYLNEYYGGSENLPKLVYTSTTDPILAYAVYVPAAYSVMRLFNQLLVTARNTVDLYRAIKLLRTENIAGAADQPMIQSANERLKLDVEKIVREELLAIESKIEETRKNELMNAVTLHCSALVPLIVEGASVGVSVESLPIIKTVAIEGLVTGQLTFIEIVTEVRKRETATRIAIAIAGGASNLRLTDDSQQQK